MYHLATVFPPAARFRRLPLSRDQVMLLMAAVNEVFLGLDTYLAHSTSGTIRQFEWIPILFGPAAGGLLLIAGLIALRRRPLATVLATVVFLASIVVGVLGAYFHVRRAILPAGPAGQQVMLDLFFWAPPVLGPLAFALVGLLGLSAAWVEDPPNSGVLDLLGGRRLHLPYSKTQAYCYLVGLGIMIALISSVLDHARTQFRNPWLWLPMGVGVLGVIVAVMLGAVDRPRRADLLTYTATMLLLIAVGALGAFLHVQRDLVMQSSIQQVIQDLLARDPAVIERIIRGAPVLAPLLFANMGMLGLLVLLDPAER